MTKKHRKKKKHPTFKRPISGVEYFIKIRKDDIPAIQNVFFDFGPNGPAYETIRSHAWAAGRILLLNTLTTSAGNFDDEHFFACMYADTKKLRLSELPKELSELIQKEFSKGIEMTPKENENTQLQNDLDHANARIGILVSAILNYDAAREDWHNSTEMQTERDFPRNDTVEALYKAMLNATAVTGPNLIDVCAEMYPGKTTTILKELRTINLSKCAQLRKSINEAVVFVQNDLKVEALLALEDAIRIAWEVQYETLGIDKFGKPLPLKS